MANFSGKYVFQEAWDTRKKEIDYVLIGPCFDKEALS